MAKTPKGVLFYLDYLDYFEYLTPDKIGKLVCDLLVYVRDGIEPNADNEKDAYKILLNLAKNRADMDLEKYQETCKRNQENAKRKKGFFEPIQEKYAV